ncbi:hypothetical protein ACI6PS_06000 [Flavobacterium sp. PLA-1-15]|uniref:hypothetical protein n=1 Tax=Flavobacterium sp. PLA-1-15 TaxID=3380533 RepID=UPI003B7BD4C4
MKNLKKSTFPLLQNDYLENILRQLVCQYAVCRIFYTPQDAGLSYLVVELEWQQDLEPLQLRPWLQKALSAHRTAVSFVSSSQLHHRSKLGHPFIACYCAAAALVYPDAVSFPQMQTDRSWKQYKKKYRTFSEQFYHDRDLQQSQLRHLIAENAGNSIFTSYARLFEYDLRYLEELYCGRAVNSSSLEARINKLAAYVPAVQKFFVSGKGNGYYLTEVFEKVKDLEGDEPYYHEELHEAMAVVADSLYGLIVERHRTLKQLIKKAWDKPALPVVEEVRRHAGTGLTDETMDIILRLKTVEQLYFYHQVTYGSKTTFYLLIVGRGISNEQLERTTQSLRSRMGDRHEFVLIGHDRYWIQSNLYAFQHFFASVMQAPFLIYSSSAYHPDLHWEVPYQPCHADLYFYYRPAKDSAAQFKTIADHPAGNYQGLDAVFALFFQSFCRTYIFVKIYYVPHYLTSEALWNLCLYADDKLRDYQYLIDTFWTDFFPYVDVHRMVRPKLTVLDGEKVQQMHVLVGLLMERLHQEVVGKGLLKE